jgi:glutamate dehydrogenase/leucine dehydrogenase
MSIATANHVIRSDLDGSLFGQARSLFLRYAKPLDLPRKYPGQALPERLVVPDKSIIFRLSLQRDNGTIQILNAYRVQFSDERGPYRGASGFTRR